MIKKFKEYINEDYFSKLASRKDNSTVRIENEITEDFVRSFVRNEFERCVETVSIKKENNKIIVDIDGSFHLRKDVEEIPFQFGKVTGDFLCSCCNLKSLKGCPNYVGGSFSCAKCENLVSLEGCPEKIGRNFNCIGCVKLKSLDGCPKEVGGCFSYQVCGKNPTEEEVSKICNVKGMILWDD